MLRTKEVKPSFVKNGFTLIEILVVLMIVSVMTGIVVANMPQFADSAEFDREAKRLALLLLLARDEALVTGHEFGFQPLDEGYEFFKFDEASRKWVKQDESPFQPRTLAENFELTLDIEGEALLIDTEESKKTPDVLILSSGESTEFELYLKQGEINEKVLVADGFGGFSWREIDGS